VVESCYFKNSVSTCGKVNRACLIFRTTENRPESQFSQPCHHLTEAEAAFVLRNATDNTTPISIINYWKENTPIYHSKGVIDVSNEDLADENKFYFGRFKQDVQYRGLNVDDVIKYLMKTSRKKDGKLKTLVDTRKYHDTLLCGSKVAEQPLPTQYYSKMEKYLAGYKKQTIAARKVGDIDNNASNLIPEPLYERVLTWALLAGNIFVWFWTLSQWNFMGRCASIDPLGFHNFSLGIDSIVGKYDDSEADKDGERLSEKISSRITKIGQNGGGLGLLCGAVCTRSISPNTNDCSLLLGQRKGPQKITLSSFLGWSHRILRK